MAKDIVIKSEVREETGSSTSRRLRRAGVLPASVGLRSGETLCLTINQHGFDQMLHHHTGESLIVTLEIANRDAVVVLLDEVQRNAVTGKTQHADFREILLTEKMTVSIGIELVGDPEGVRAGGVLEQSLYEVDLECLPTDMVEVVEVDVSEMKIGDTLLLKDILLPPKHELVSDPDLPVASVAMPRAEEEPEEEEPGEAEEEPAIVGEDEKKAEEEE